MSSSSSFVKSMISFSSSDESMIWSCCTISSMLSTILDIKLSILTNSLDGAIEKFCWASLAGMKRILSFGIGGCAIPAEVDGIGDGILGSSTRGILRFEMS